MASLNAKAVAMEVVEMIGKRQKVNYRSLLKKHGYSDSIANRPERVTKTKSYQSIVIPALKQMESVRGKMLKALDNRDMTKEKTPVLLSGVDILTRNTQLLGGKATDNVAIQVEISEQVANKYQDLSNKADNEGK